jgi:hypothetical protein
MDNGHDYKLFNQIWSLSKHCSHYEWTGSKEKELMKRKIHTDGLPLGSPIIRQGTPMQRIHSVVLWLIRHIPKHLFSYSFKLHILDRDIKSSNPEAHASLEKTSLFVYIRDDVLPALEKREKKTLQDLSIHKGSRLFSSFEKPTHRAHNAASSKRPKISDQVSSRKASVRVVPANLSSTVASSKNASSNREIKEKTHSKQSGTMKTKSNSSFFSSSAQNIPGDYHDTYAFLRESVKDKSA